MANSLKIQDYKDGKLITLSYPVGDRAKILNMFYGFVFFLSALVFPWMFIENSQGLGLGLSLFTLAMGAVLCIAAYRFFKKAFLSEKLFVNEEVLEIIVKSLFTKKRQIFELNKIFDLRFNDKPKYEDHPLKGESFDYLGFQTEQQVIQGLAAEGRLSFEYDGKKVFFGENLFSWDFDEIEGILHGGRGNSNRYAIIEDRN